MPGGAAEKPARNRRAVVAGVVAAILIVLLVVPVYSTLQPAYYSRYGDLRVRMDQWRHSTHARMSCSACHVDPGARGLLMFGVRAIPAFYSQLLFGPTKTNLLRAPDIAACQKCHTSFRQVSPDGDLLIPHRAHVQILKVNCVVCHEKLVHTSNPAGINRPRMAKCLALCHDGKKATSKCTKCHTRKQTPVTHKWPNWLEVHSEVAKQDSCDECHAWSPDFCADCHKKRPVSHAGNWKSNHQVRARRSDRGCRVCHTEQFCKRCH